jgi:hypothetical protein
MVAKRMCEVRAKTKRGYLFCVQVLTFERLGRKEAKLSKARNDSNPVEETKILAELQAIMYIITKLEFLEIL